MKIELEQEDIKGIAQSVAELIEPIYSNNTKHEDVIFTVEELAQYLKVKEQWVYEKVHNKEIPHYKIGKYLRFRMSSIDEWLKKKERGSSRKPANNVTRLLEDAA